MTTSATAHVRNAPAESDHASVDHRTAWTYAYDKARANGCGPATATAVADEYADLAVTVDIR